MTPEQYKAFLAAIGGNPGIPGLGLGLMGQAQAQPQIGQAPAQFGGMGGQPQAPAAGGFDFAKIIQALNAPHGRHLGMGGQEITNENPLGNAGGDPFSNGFFQTKDQRIAKEKANFGQSFTASEQTNPMGAMAATQAPPQTMGHQTSWSPFQGGQDPTFGSPVYRQQHPDFNMFSDPNWAQMNGLMGPKPPNGQFAFGAGQNSGKKKSFSSGMLPRR